MLEPTATLYRQWHALRPIPTITGGYYIMRLSTSGTACYAPPLIGGALSDDAV